MDTQNLVNLEVLKQNLPTLNKSELIKVVEYFISIQKKSEEKGAN